MNGKGGGVRRKRRTASRGRRERGTTPRQIGQRKKKEPYNRTVKENRRAKLTGLVTKRRGEGVPGDTDLK